MALNWGLLLVVIGVLLVGCSNNSKHYSEGQDQAAGNYLNLAKGYIEEGYVEKALKPLQRALKITPRSSDVYGMLALVYQLGGENKEAEKAFKKALNYNSDAADVQNNYGAFLFSQERFDEAYKYFSQAANNLFYDKRSRAYENMGIVAQKQNRNERAKYHFIKALKLNGKLITARLELAYILHQHGEYRSAWSHYLIFAKQSDQNSRSLWLGVQLARKNADRNAAASYGLQLEKMYPQSKEYREYRSQGRE
ncbi:MAG: type IV pilus biogenesis/stability protein PilW [Candidatus Endonucleobacter bathymodioli]|uniref:Type IV pilus biogenesis/stability protein PilW n=1 Tax=Candidatus Endonucleibacter bathymodioli TaxID=539814 RepID=A0AA90P2D6_9GAMM|nr:type IV pilus biogenesis/stability protein PilW [Candidatus Endonucleobacter bathymodioli]